MPTAAFRMIAGWLLIWLLRSVHLQLRLVAGLIGDGSRQLLRTSRRLQLSLLVHKPRLSGRGFPHVHLREFHSHFDAKRKSYKKL